MEIQNLYQKYSETGKVSTDTRQITQGSVFFALRGEKFNANEFAQQAIEKGASYAVIDDPGFVKDDRYIVVDDVLLTLQNLARHHRNQFSIPFIGLTGSNGKTTSKELLNAVLNKKYKTFATKGNLNNHIGVPLTILAMDKSIEIAVVEMGANHVGEIAMLCNIANPTHGFITNIGRAHIGMFGGFENIIRAKSELYQHLLMSNGQVFINSQNEILANIAKRFKAPLFYPAKKDFYHAALIGSDPYVSVQAANGDVVNTKLIGGYNFENIAAALCLGKFFEVDDMLANEAIAEYVPDNMRSQVLVKNTNTIILDAYNANPSSMHAAVENLAAMKAKSKVVILGDMFELGDEAEHEHRALLKQIEDKKFNDVYVCGSLFNAIKQADNKVKYFLSKDDLIKELKQRPIENATILVKASRGIGLETIVDIL